MTALAAAPELCLPWESSAAEDRRFRKILFAALGVLSLVAVAMPLLPLRELVEVEKMAEPPTLTRVILEKKALPEPEPIVVQAKPRPKPKPRPVEKEAPPRPVAVKKMKPEPVPTPADKMANAREAAAAAGVLAFQDDLQELRDSVDVSTLDQTRTSRGESSAAATQRSIIGVAARADSGGIQTAALSSDTGGPALSARQTTTVTSTIAGNATEKVAQSGTAQLGGRSDDSIRRVMDENKGVIFAIYNRALRKDPMLQGKLVFEMVIDASGNIQELQLLSSELVDTQLTGRILSRIRLIRFGSERVGSTRVNYSFDFLPYS